MEKTISVHENPTFSKKLGSLALAAIVWLIAIFVAGFIGLFVGAVAFILIEYWGFGWIGSKTTASIITTAGRIVPYNTGRVAFAYGGVAGGVWGAVEGRSNVFLCNEGVVIKRFIMTMLYPWDRIKEFAANPENKRVWFNFGVNYYANRPLVQVGENFSEVERILSQHITKRVPV